MSLQVDVIFDENQCALLILQIDPAGSVGEDDRAHPHASEDADRKCDFLRGVAFIQMCASLHGRHGNRARFSDDHLPSVADRR